MSFCRAGYGPDAGSNPRSAARAICQYLECQPGDLLIHEPEVE
ncbi:helix-turn-helix transcriptional regulator [Pseudomonas sp. NFIX28]|nr:helix-turn-helix transcriptional regulator [Pseudomonas sp. NFIX28]